MRRPTAATLFGYLAAGLFLLLSSVAASAAPREVTIGIPAQRVQRQVQSESLRLPPFESFGEISFGEAVLQHWPESSAALALLALLALFVVRLKLDSTRAAHLATLEESNAKYRALFEGAGDYILVLSPPGEDTPPLIVDANEAAFIRHGYSREELIGKPIFFLDTQAAAEKNRTVTRRVMQHDGALTFESEHRCRDGSTFPVEISSRFIRVGSAPPCILSIERDITERKTAQERLRQSEERFRVLFDKVANIAVQGYAPDGTVRFWNKASERLFGYTAEEAIGRHLADLVIPPEMAGLMREAIEDMVETGEGHPAMELTFRRKDGSKVPVYANHTVVDIPGRGRELYCIDIDLTQRKSAEKAFLQSELKFRGLLEELPDMVVVHRGGRILYVNRMVEKLSGFSREELLGTNLLARVAEKDRAKVIGNMAQRGARERVEDYELDLLHRDGSFRSAVARTNQVLFDNEPAVVVILIDITERKESENRIEHLNRVLRAIRCVDQLILREKNPANLIDEACRLLVEHRGYSEAAILLLDDAGAPCAFVAAGSVGEKRPGREHPGFRTSPPCCQAFRDHEGVFPLSPGEELCAGCPLLPVTRGASVCIGLNFEKTLYGLLLVTVEAERGGSREIDRDERILLEELAKDVTFALFAIEQGRLKEQLQEERDQFESELRHAQKMEAVGRLAGGVAHDFNNMLGVIIGYAYVSKSLLEPADPLYSHLDEIEKAAERSAALTRQLLAFSRKAPTAPTRLNLNVAINEMRKMLARLIGEEVALEFVPGPDLWDVRVDPSHVDQILANLTVNAKDAISGVGTIVVGTANLTVHPAAPLPHQQLAPGDYVQITVADTGCGMDAETLERIFEPFYTTKGEGKGTGLGLSTVYGIVKQGDGCIQVESEPGRGTTFAVWFPRHRGTAEPAAVESAPERANGGDETVLLVEDNRMLLELSRKILADRGYRVLTAATPAEACLISDSHEAEIHLLLTDVVMPDMNGRELQSRIREKRAGIRTLFMSGYSSDILTHHGVVDRGLNYINKPFAVQAFVEKVRRVLEAGSEG